MLLELSENEARLVIDSLTEESENMISKYKCFALATLESNELTSDECNALIARWRKWKKVNELITMLALPLEDSEWKTEILDLATDNIETASRAIDDVYRVSEYERHRKARAN